MESEQGAISTFYMARDRRLSNSPCVVEKLRKDFPNQEKQEKALLLFQRKAFYLSHLKHPNIAHILDSFEEDGDHFLVTEYVEGENLLQILQQPTQPLSESLVFSWVQQIASALKYLHNHESPIIYDTKLSDIIIDKKGQVMLRGLE